MNKKKIVTLTVLFAALITLTAADPWIDNVQVSDKTPEVGETIEVSATASDSGTITWLQARRKGGNWDSRYCNRIAVCSNTDNPWKFTFQSLGTYTVEIRAKNSDTTDSQGEVVTKTIQVGSGNSGGRGVPVSLEKVAATKFDISRGETFQIQAGVKNSDTSYGKRVKVVWYAMGESNYRLGSSTEGVNSDSTNTLTLDNVGWSDLKDKGLKVGKRYELKAKLFYDSNGDGSFDSGEVVERRSAARKLVLRPFEQGSLSLSSVSVGKQEVSRGQRTRFSAEVDNSFDYDKRVTVKWFVVDEGYPKLLDQKTSTVRDNSNQVFDSDYLTWKELTGGNLGLEAGKSYRVKAKIYSDGSLKDSRFASAELYIRESNRDKDSNDRPPNPDLSVSTVYSNSFSKRLRFDATGSFDPDRGSLDYSFDLDGLGGFERSFDGDGVVEKTYYSDFSDRVRVKVTDDEGNSRVDRQYVVVDVEDRQSDGGGDQPDGDTEDRCGISRSSFDFSLDDYTVTRGDSTQAELKVSNSADNSQRIRVEFKVGGSVARQRTVTVPAHGSRTLTAQVSPESDSFVSANVYTSGAPCGSRSFTGLAGLTAELTVLDGSEDQGSLDVSTVTSNGAPVSGVRVEVNGPEDRTGFTGFQGATGFELEPGSYEVTVSHPRYGTENRNIRIQSGESEDIQFTLSRDQDYSPQDGTLEVTVLDEDGDWIEDARVEIRNGDDRTHYTNTYGYTDFRLEEGRYEIDISRSGYEDESGTVYIESGETDTRVFRLERNDRGSDQDPGVDEDGLEITSVSYPETVCRGRTLSVRYTVKNHEEYDESAETVASGLGGSIVTNTYVIESGETVSGTLRFTNVQGSGTESFTIRVQNGNSDRVTRTVKVRDCTAENPETEQRASSVSMKLSYPLSPNRALVGDTVKVSGFVDGVRGRTSVKINVNGERAAQVTTQPDGYYQTYIRAESTGTKTVRAVAAGKSASRQLVVLPTASIGGIEAPQRVFEGRSYRVCANVNSQVKPSVILLRDGEVVKETSGKGRVCFNRTATRPGTHVYEVRVFTGGESATARTSVRVLATDVEASSFPDQVASVESGDAIVRIELYNTHQELRRYQLHLRGLPSTWLSKSRKEVVLDTGERKTVYFYLTPRSEGDYNPEIVISADNQQIYREKIDLEVGGIKEPRQRSFMDRFLNLLSF